MLLHRAERGARVEALDRSVPPRRQNTASKGSRTPASVHHDRAAAAQALAAAFARAGETRLRLQQLEQGLMRLHVRGHAMP